MSAELGGNSPFIVCADSDLDAAARPVQQHRMGNCSFVRDLAAPFGGSRDSRVGREGGTWSFDFYTDIKNISIRKGSFV